MAAGPGNMNFADQELAGAWATAELLALPVVHTAKLVLHWQPWEYTKFTKVGKKELLNLE